MLTSSRRFTPLAVSLFLAAVLGLSVGVPDADAQTTDVIGVRAQGMSGAFTAVADDATASYWNPAGLAGGAFFNALIEFDRPDTSSSATVRGVAVAYPALGLTYYRIPLRNIRLTASTESSSLNRQDDEGVISLYGATVGQSFGNHLVLGSTLKLLRAADTNVSVDVGAMASFGPMRVGLMVRDVTEPSFGSGPAAYTLSRHARLGAALTSGRRGVVGSATVSVDADLTTAHDPIFGDERVVAVGGEVWAPRRNIGVRGGVSTNTAAGGATGVSGGLSFAIRSGTFVDAYLTGGSDEARRGWGLALRVTF